VKKTLIEDAYIKNNKFQTNINYNNKDGRKPKDFQEQQELDHLEYIKN
jgi:hypothetical protein